MSVKWAFVVALVAVAHTAAARPCRSLPRREVEAGFDAGVTPPTGRDVMLADEGYRVGHGIVGLRLGMAYYPLPCVELGSTYRLLVIDEGTAPDGAVLRSLGQAFEVTVGFRIPTSRMTTLAMLFDGGPMFAAQTLRGERTSVEGTAFGGRDELTIGAGPTAVFVALDLHAWFPPTGESASPRLNMFAIQVGFAYRFQ